MSPIETAIIERKIATIADCLRLLAPFTEVALADYVSDVYRRNAAERLVQKLVEAMVDINYHVLREAHAAVPDDMYGSFVDLGGLGVVPPELATRLASSAGLRNRLVHEYDALDHAKILAAIATAQRDVPLYVAAILATLKRT